MVFVPMAHRRSAGYSSEDVKRGVLEAYREIKEEEKREALKKKIEEEWSQFEDDFDMIIGTALINGEDIKF